MPAVAAAAVAELSPRLAVAVSGGRDSLALLHAACRSARALGLEVVALHVNHGLMPEAPVWEAGLRRRVRQWAKAGWPVQLEVERLPGGPVPAESVEAWARRARYAALGRMARAAGCSLVLLAHHRRDQAETVLLQALRAAGPAGLSAMPRQREAAGLVWARPWIDQPPEAVEAYARRHGLRWVEDPSNADPRFDRSRLRRDVWPVLAGAFDQAEAALARVAAWQQDAQAAVEALAAVDLAACCEGCGVPAAAGAVIADSGEGSGGGAGDARPAPTPTLLLAPWSSLPPGRRAGALRLWLAHATGGPASEGAGRDDRGPDAPAAAPAGRLLARLLAELPHARTGARWDLPGPAGGRLRLGCRAGGRLVVLAGPASAAGLRPVARAASLGIAEVLGRSGEHRLPGWPGRFEVRAVPVGGVALEWLHTAVLRPRTGGERFQSGPGRPPRSLKQQFQAAGVPEWERHGPLLWSQGPAQRPILLWVAGLGVDARASAPPGVPQVALVWHPDPPEVRQPPAGEPR